MFFYIALSAFFGAILGTMYGFLFVRRVKRSVSQQNPVSFACSFFISYCLIAVTLFTLMTLYKINIVLGLAFFLVAFWIIVWKNAGRLSL